MRAVRKYHSTYYAPHNLALLITGKVNPTKLLQVLQDTVEPSIVKHQQAHGPHGPKGWKRPFLETGSKGGGRVLKKQKEEVVEFPEKDESSGEVQISWIGPKTTVCILLNPIVAALMIPCRISWAMGRLTY